MSDYNYIFKVLVLGGHSVGKRLFVNRYFANSFKFNYGLTLGVDFFSKIIQHEDLRIKLQFWVIAHNERFNHLLPTLFKGARGAIIMYDITRAESLQKIGEWSEKIHEGARNVPIILVGNKKDQEKEREVTPEIVERLIEENDIRGQLEISVKTGENVDQVLNMLGSSIVENLYTEESIIPGAPKYIIPEYRINKYLKVKLEHGKTIIYVNERRFYQCKYLLFNIPVQKFEDYDEIDSIDEAAEKLDKSMEGGRYYIPPETEFWGHCSNLQAWYEHNYDTRLLHRNLAFPLLKALADAGDRLAQKVFKDEIALRLESSYPSVVAYLINQGYLEYLTTEELDLFLDNPQFIQSVVRGIGSFERLPQWLSDKIQDKINNAIKEEILNLEIKSKDFIDRKIQIPFPILEKIDKELLIQYFEKNLDWLLNVNDVKVRIQNIRSFSKLGVTAADHYLKDEILKCFKSKNEDLIFFLLTEGYMDDVNFVKEEDYYCFIKDDEYSRLVRSFVVAKNLVKGVIFKEKFYPVKNESLDLKGLGIKSLSHVIGIRNQKNLKELNVADNLLKDLHGMEKLRKLKRLKIVGNKLPKHLTDNLGGIDEKGYALEPLKFVKYARKKFRR